jgi:hypothetical protein
MREAATSSETTVSTFNQVDNNLKTCIKKYEGGKKIMITKELLPMKSKL